MGKTTRESPWKSIGLILGIVAVIGSGVWNVATINASTHALTSSIKRLDTTLQGIDRQIVDHNTRISRLEGRSGP